jgi:alcohol dehydrogenase class IV
MIMAEIVDYLFSYQEVVEALIKHQGIHEGLWSLRVEFALGAANVHTTPGGAEMVPAAIIPLQSIGLQRSASLNNLTVDAAIVNPSQTENKPKGRSGKKEVQE